MDGRKISLYKVQCYFRDVKCAAVLCEACANMRNQVLGFIARYIKAFTVSRISLFQLQRVLVGCIQLPSNISILQPRPLEFQYISYFRVQNFRNPPFNFMYQVVLKLQYSMTVEMNRQIQKLTNFMVCVYWSKYLRIKSKNEKLRQKLII